MSIWRTHIFGLVVTLSLLFAVQTKVSAADKTEITDVGKDKSSVGGYTPCIVLPVFIEPNIPPPVITKGEIVKPTIVRSEPLRWQVELADIEKPTFVEKVILPARYDGCYRLSEERRAARKGNYYNPTISGGSTRLGPGSIAARLLNAADQCCGNAGGK